MPNDQPTRRFRFTLKQLFLLVALVGVGLAVGKWVFRKEVVVRVATPDDKVSSGTFAVLTGSFTRSTWLVVSMHVVQVGMIDRGTECVFGRGEMETKGPLWRNMTFGLSFGFGTKMFTLSTIGIASHSHAITKPVIDNFNVVAKQTVPGTITPGRPHIVYVEGDKAIVVDGSMTVEEFAKANPGNYLVVTVEVR